MMQRPFVGNLLTSDPVRYARNVAVLEAEPSLAIGWPTVAWTDAALRVMREMAEPSYPGKIRQPILIIAAGQDADRVDAGDRRVRGAAARRLPPYRSGRAPRTADGAGSLSQQVLAAFDAFVPGTPLFA